MLTAKVSRPPLAGRLERRVRPKGQKGTPGLEDGRNPRKSAVPREQRRTAKMIAGSAYYANAGGQKGLKLAQSHKAKPGGRPKPQKRNPWERRNAGINGCLHKADSLRD